jgi:flagella basal body P-ring formation protein FlgA
MGFRPVRLVAVVVLVAASVTAGEPEAVTLKLRAEAVVTSDNVTLGDVLVRVAGDATLLAQIGGEPISAKPDAEAVTTVSHDQILRRLDELGVNLGRVLLSGPLTCRVVQRAPPADEVAEEPILREGRGPTKTLADLVREHINDEMKDLGGAAEVQFERAGQEFLQLAAPPWEFQVSSLGREKLGLCGYRVVIRRDGQVQRKADVFARVRLVRPVVVARKPLNPGNAVRPDDVTTETRIFDQATGLGFAELAAVVGQQVKRFVPAGEPVPPDALKIGDLVARTRPVTVLSDNPNVQVRLSGVALDSGGYGDSVRVRVGDARREKKVLTGVVAGVGTVRLAGDAP